MNSKKNIYAIGGLGGSGTRAVAEILAQAGVFIGDDINVSNDNLTFTRLFKDPDWYAKANQKEVGKRLTAFRDFMEFDKITVRDYGELYAAAKKNKLQPAGRDYYKRIFSMLTDKKQLDPSNAKRKNWAWKEPNTQIYTKEILAQFDELKYIHVLRHGLDMAFSRNMQQLKNWGWKYGIQVGKNDSDSDKYRKQLDYWTATTQETKRLKEIYPDRVYIVNFGALCANPVRTIDQLFSFCNIELDRERMKDIYSIPQISQSFNRYKKADLSVFSPDQLETVKSLGFAI